MVILVTKPRGVAKRGMDQEVLELLRQFSPQPLVTLYRTSGTLYRGPRLRLLIRGAASGAGGGLGVRAGNPRAAQRIFLFCHVESQLFCMRGC